MTIALADVIHEVRAFIAAKKAITAEIGEETALFQAGYIDSFSVVELTAALGKRFGLNLGGGALIPDDFDTPRTLCDRLNEVAS